MEQALARCSVSGSKFWFNCNPEHPGHWFYTQWIKKRREKRALYLHFTMEDNPSLTPEIIRRYQKLYSGAFYERFVLGRWSAVTGRCIPCSPPRPMWLPRLPGRFERYLLSCDYGIVNPCSAGLWGLSAGVWYRCGSTTYDAKAQNAPYRTDEEHYRAIEALCGGLSVEEIVLDPSAKSLMETIKSHGRFRPIPADNGAARHPGSDGPEQGKILIGEGCRDAIREFSLYRWDESGKKDQVVKALTTPWTISAILSCTRWSGPPRASSGRGTALSIHFT